MAKTNSFNYATIRVLDLKNKFSENIFPQKMCSVQVILYH